MPEGGRIQKNDPVRVDWLIQRLNCLHRICPKIIPDEGIIG